MQRQLSALRLLFLFVMLCFLFTMCKKRSVLIESPVPRKEYHELVAVTETINSTFGGYYVALPPHYDERNDSFPLLLFLHGLGQVGNGNSDLHYITFDGIGKLIDDKKFPASFAWEGKLYSFIVVSPQSSKTPTPDEVMQVLNHVKNKYRVSSDRIYLSGLSMGARIVTLTAAAYPQSFAAIVPIAGVATGPGLDETCREIAGANLPVWELHNADDPMAPVSQAKQFINLLGSYKPSIKPRITIFDVYGHDAWTTALDPNYEENGMNIYEWMLQYRR